VFGLLGADEGRHAHRPIEECFQSAKNETGLDHYQVRRYDAWHRHITPAMLAHAYLAVTAARVPKHNRSGPPHTR
jgi:SRSO17 transposase